MDWEYNTKYPLVSDLRNKAKRRIPKFAFEYLDGGCNEDINLHKNISGLREVELKPYYLRNYTESSLKTCLFGKEYDAPFGVSPVGLQGLIWPRAAEILAKAAHKHNIPFVLSTVTTSNIERISELTEGNAWFQLYNPANDGIRNDILNRATNAGYSVLVLICDVPTFAYRPRDIKNGLAMPPKMTFNNILRMFGKPNWALQSLRAGKPNFETLKPYIPKNLGLKGLGKVMDELFNGRLNEQKIAPIRDLWKGKIILKGVASLEDAEKAIALGIDGLIVSNHGGRQLDAAEPSIKPLKRIASNYGDKIMVAMDSGIRSGPDIARAIASGAQFTFMGKSFMYGVAALGDKGGNHTISIFKTQLRQVMEQLCCQSVEDLPNHLVPSNR